MNKNENGSYTNNKIDSNYQKQKGVEEKKRTRYEKDKIWKEINRKWMKLDKNKSRNKLK